MDRRKFSKIAVTGTLGIGFSQIIFPASEKAKENDHSDGSLMVKSDILQKGLVTLSIGPNLFIDDYLIAESCGLQRTTHQPEKLAEPILDQDRPTFHLSALYDDNLGMYRMWYNAMTPKKGIAYAESRDGIHWDLPELGLIEENLVDFPLGHWGCTLIDEGREYAEPSRRYKMAHYDSGMAVGFSADGMKFTPYEKNPVLPANLPDYHSNVISDIIDICYDPLKGEYLMGCKLWREGYPGKPLNAEEGSRRCVGMSTSKDFINWGIPDLIITPDLHNGLEEFYGFMPSVRGNLYIGFLRILRDDLPATPGGPVEGIGWTELMTSRDGRNWTRYQEPFIDRDPRENIWDHAMAWYGDSITVGDKDYIYYGGFRAGHKIREKRGDRDVGMGILRKNGFVSRDADSGGGILKTPPAVIPGKQMTVNANVSGELQIRLIDAEGEVLPGFDRKDCVPLKGDSVAHEVKWHKSRVLPQGEIISMEFSLRDAELYGFDFVD